MKLRCLLIIFTILCNAALGGQILSEGFETASAPGMKTKASIVPGKFGNALQFDKNNEFATIEVGHGFPLLEGSIDFWMKISRKLEKTDPTYNILSIVGTPQYWNRFQLYLVSPKKRIYFTVCSDKYSVPNQWNADFLVSASIANWKPEQWHRVTVLWKNLNSGDKKSSVGIYLDGKRVQRIVGRVTLTKTGKTIVLGKDKVTSMPAFPGAIDNLAVNNQVSSDAEIASSKNNNKLESKRPDMTFAAPVKFGRNQSLISIGKAPKLPVLDGKISRGEWDTASYTKGFLDSATGEMLYTNALLRGMYDEKNLYLSLWGIFPGQAPKVKSGKFLDNYAVKFLVKHKNGKFYEFGLDANGVKRCIANNDAITGMNWDGKITMVDSGEIGGSALTFSKSIWQAEIAIPFKKLGFDKAPVSKINKMNFSVNFPQGPKNTRLEWALSPDKAIMSTNFGNIRFSGKTPPKLVDCNVAEIANGDVFLEVKRNKAASSVKWYSQAELVRVGESKPYFNRLFPENFFAGKSGKVINHVPISFKKKEKMLLSYRVVDLFSEALLFQRACNYQTHLSIKVKPLVLYSRNVLEVNIDLSAFTPRPKSTSCEIKLLKKKSKEVVLSRTIDSSSKSGKSSSEINIAAVKPGEYQVQVAVSGKGKVLGKVTKAVTIHPKPSWWKNDLGKVTKIMKPWSPVRVSGNTVDVWNRSYIFKDRPFQANIKVGNKPLFDGAITLKVVDANGTVSWQKAKLHTKRISDLEAVVTCEVPSKRITLEGKSRVEFDGFTRIDWSLKPVAGAVKLKEVQIVVPFKADDVLYMKGMAMEDWRSDNFGIYSACLYPTTVDPKYGDIISVHKKWNFSMKGWLWPDKFCHELWIGNDDEGVSFMFDSPVNWQTAKYIETKRKGDKFELIFNIISKDYVLKKPLKYAMAIQATPVKPLPKDPKSWRVGYRGGSKPSESSKELSLAVQYRINRGPGWPKFTERGLKFVQNWAKEGVKLTTPFYSNITTAEMPEYKIFGHEWEIKPKIAWSFGWTHGSGGTGVMVSQNGIYGDFYLHAVNKLIKQGAKGIYIDSSAVLASTNKYTNSGYIDSDGKRKPTIGLFNTRKVYKRLYNMFKTKVPDSVIWVHSTPITALASFVDVTCEGEEWTDFKRKEKWEFDIGYLTPDVFRAGYMIYGYRGIPFLFYPGFPRGYPKKVSQADMLPICLAHNVFPIDYGYPLYRQTWKLMNNWYTTSKWIPYWKNSHMVKSFSNKVKIGVYAKKAEGKYLLLVANLLGNPQEGKVTIYWKGFGLTPDKVKLTAVGPGAESSAPIKTVNGQFAVELPKLRCRYFLIEQK